MASSGVRQREPRTALSVIVPTRNRAAMLADAVRSIAPQVPAEGDAEVIVVDSASTDRTPETAALLADEFPGLRALRAAEPGLHAARHLGAAAAHGDLLVFVDDDVIARPGWLAACRSGFADPAVALVGGPVRPRWEAPPPWWVELFRTPLPFAPGAWTIPPLSLLEGGAGERDIPPEYVYGCNFAVRRAALERCGGFHPDSVPEELTHLRGDGETALALAIGRAGLRARYVPGAALEHRIPPERLTKEYFRRRAFLQGVSNSYAALRREHGLEPPAPAGDAPPPPLAARARRVLGEVLRRGPARWREGRALLASVAQARGRGEAFHRAAVAGDPALLAWVLRRGYLDAPLPAGGPAPVVPWAAGAEAGGR